MEEKAPLRQLLEAEQGTAQTVETAQKPEIFVQQCLSPELEEKLSLYFENIQKLLLGIRVRNSIILILFIVLIVLLSFGIGQ